MVDTKLTMNMLRGYPLNGRHLRLLLSVISLGISSLLAADERSHEAIKSIEIFHLSRYTSTIVGLSPESLRRSFGWHLILDEPRQSQKEWQALVALDGGSNRKGFDCRWHILFRNAGGEIIAELNLDALEGKGEINGKPCQVVKAFWIQLHEIAQSIDPDEDPPPSAK